MFPICITYLMILFFSLGCTSLLSLLMILEVLSWMFVLLLPTFFSLNYLLIQSYFLILSLISLLSSPFILILSFLIKLGLPPFHMWFIRLTSIMSKGTFSFMMTFHKFLPILFLGKILSSSLSFNALALSLFMVGMLLGASSTLLFTLVFSSLMHSVWMVTSMVLSKSFVLFYWSSYSSLLMLLVSVLGFIKMKQSVLNQSMFSSKCWLIMSGVPPFMMFWMKVHIMTWLMFTIGIFMSGVFLLMSVIALTSYYRSWHFGNLMSLNHIISMSLGPFIYIFMLWAIFY